MYLDIYSVSVFIYIYNLLTRDYVSPFRNCFYWKDVSLYVVHGQTFATFTSL